MRGKLSNILNHGDCISEEMMLDYIAGKLSPLDQHRVEKHLLECELCSDALDGLSMQSVQPVSATLKDLDQRIDKRMNRGQEKIPAPQWLYRIAAILVTVALFMGGLYYLQSVKKSEKVFTENFEPYRDTAHPAMPVASAQSQDETINERKEKITAVNKKAEQKSAGKDTKDISSQPVSRVQTTTTAKSGSGEVVMQSRNTAGADYKKTDKVNGIPATGASSARPVVDAESGNKKMEADESEKSDALAKNTQPAKPVREELKIKSTRKNEQVHEAVAPSYESTITIADSTGSGQNELVNEGIRQYEAKNYTAAISVLQQALAKQPGNADALFYSGVSNLSLNEDRVAINQLESVLTNSPNKFSDAARWYLSLAYVKKNKIAKAKKLLKDLSLGNSEYKSIAQKTLDELK